MAVMRKSVYLAPYLSYPLVGAEDQRTCAGRGFGLLRRRLESARADSTRRLTLSGVASLQTFFSGNSDERESLRQLLESGAFDLNPFFLAPDAAAISGESLIRNLLYGLRYAHCLLHTHPDFLVADDRLGALPQLPQLAAQFGLEAIIAPAAHNLPLHIRLAPSGSELLGVHVDPSPPLRRATDVSALLEAADPAGRPNLNLSQDDATDSLEWLPRALDHLQLMGLAVSTPRLFLSEMRAEEPVAEDHLPIAADFPAAAPALPRSDLAQAARLAESRLLDAERWATFASLLGAQYPDLALDRAWRQTLLAQQQDAHSGALGLVPLVDLLGGCREALDLAAEVETNSLAYLAAAVDTSTGRHLPAQSTPLLVFNSLGWTRTDVCTAEVTLTGPFAEGFRLLDERGKEVPAQLLVGSEQAPSGRVEFAFIAADLPSVGYRTYYLAPATGLPPAAQPAPEDTIESDQYRISADREAGGGLVSIFDKQAQREVLNSELGPANEVLALARAPESEAPGLSLTGRLVKASDESAEMAALRGPVFSQLLISGDLPNRCGLLQEVTIYHGLRRIGLRTTIENYRGRQEILALSFPLAAKGLLTREDQFAVTTSRPSPRSLPAEAEAALANLRHARNWAEVGPSAALQVLERGAAPRNVPLGARVLIAAHRKDWVAVRPLLQALLSRGISAGFLGDEDASRQTLPCDFAISLRRGNLFAQSALEANPGAQERLDESLKGNEWAALLLPWVDPSHPERSIPMLIADASDAISMSHLCELVADAIVADSLQLRTSDDPGRLAKPADDYGVALLGRGLAAALDSESRLIAPLLLARPTDLGDSSALDSPLDPERRSHVFGHALLPHAGDWRAAGVVRAGFEFNHPLRPVIPAAGRGAALPAQFSFVAVDTTDAVISAIKPVGNPGADHTSHPSTPETGLLVRVYEAHGRPVKAHVSFGLEIEESWKADLLERKSEDLPPLRNGWSLPGLLKRRSPAPTLPLELSTGEIATFGARLARPSVGEPTELGVGVNPAVAHSEYWEHNSGAAPLGNQPLTLWLGGPIPVGKNTRFTLALSNDSCDQELAGRVRVTAPPDWPLIPKEVPYRIAPASQAVYEVMVVVPPDAAPCFLRATTEDGQRVVQDVVPIGEIQPLALSLRRAERAFVVGLENPNPDYVEGEVLLITPPEAWGKLSDDLALACVTPRAHPFRLDANREQSFTFTTSGDSAAVWAIAKVTWYGRVQYATLAP